MGYMSELNAHYQELDRYHRGELKQKPTPPEPRGIRETPAATEARMLAKAIDQGIRLWWSRKDGTWYATSSQDRRTSYAVSIERCGCEGFRKFGYCKHWALMRHQEATAAQEDTPPPPPPPAAPAATEHHRRGTTPPDDTPGAVLNALQIMAERAALNDDNRERATIGAEISTLCGIFGRNAPHVEPEITYRREWIMNAALEAYRRETGELEDGDPWAA